MAVNVIDTLKPKNNGDFPIVESEDVAVGSIRLDAALEQKAEKTALDATNAAVADKANAADVTAATTNLQAQIDELITPVTQDAEVQNARVAEDGTSYTTLKQRLDTEATDQIKSILAAGYPLNLLPVAYASGPTYENKGITFTVQADGSVYSEGTATGQARYYWLENAPIKAGIYTVSGAPSGADATTFRYSVLINGTAIGYFTGNHTFEVENDSVISIRTIYETGYVDSGHYWYIMLEKGDTHVKYIEPKYSYTLLRADVDTNKAKIVQNESDIAIVNGRVNTLAADIRGIDESLKSLKDLTGLEFLDATWERGTLSSTGLPGENDKRIIMEAKIKLSGNARISVAEGYRYIVYYYESSDSRYCDQTRADGGTSGWVTASDDYTTEGNVWINICIAKVRESGTYTADPTTWSQYLYIDYFLALVSKVNTSADTIEILNTYVSNNVGRTLPDYLTTYLESKKSYIMDAITGTGAHGDSFIFFTDYHYKQTDYNTYGYSYLPDIFRALDMRKIVFGGDILDTHATKAEALEILEKFKRDYGKFNIYTIYGNHENNPYSTNPEAILDRGEVYSVLYRGIGMEERAELNTDMYFYFDNKVQKIRYICPNTWNDLTEWTNDTTQHEWLVNVLQDAPAGYGIVLLPHIAFKLSDDTIALESRGLQFEALLDAWATHQSGTWNNVSFDFTNNTGTVICIMAGHTHRDGVVYSNEGYPIIGTVCEAEWGSGQTVTRGTAVKYTYAEHAFDIVCINTTTRKINCVRIGSGADREFTF